MIAFNNLDDSEDRKSDNINLSPEKFLSTLIYNIKNLNNKINWINLVKLRNFLIWVQVQHEQYMLAHKDSVDHISVIPNNIKYLMYNAGD